MSNLKLFWQNEWDNGTITYTSQSPLWPATNTQQRQRARAWRTRYGAGSGWGRFLLSATTNLLYFDEGGGTLTATMTAGTYTPDTLAVEIATQMEAVGAHDYTCYYDEATNKFVIQDDTGTVSLLCATDTNAIWFTIGFTTGVDLAAAASHTADTMRLHTTEYVRATFTESISIDGVFVFGHNLSESASLRMDTTIDGWVTRTSHALARHGDVYAALFTASLPCNAAQIVIIDPENPDGYIEIGRVWIGASFEPGNGFDNQSEPNVEDNSVINESDGFQGSGVENPQRVKFPMSFDHVEAADRVLFKDMFADRGILRPFVAVYAMDGVWTDPEERTLYCRFRNYPKWTYKSGVYKLGFELVEEL